MRVVDVLDEEEGGGARRPPPNPSKRRSGVVIEGWCEGCDRSCAARGWSGVAAAPSAPQGADGAGIGKGRSISRGRDTRPAVVALGGSERGCHPSSLLVFASILGARDSL